MVLLGGLSCARTNPLSNRDRCALQGMELQGVTLSRARSRGVHGNSSASGRALSCAPPPDVDSRVCQVNAYAARANYKRDHGAATGHGLDEVLKQAAAAWRSTYRRCMVDAGHKPDADADGVEDDDDEQE